MADGRVRAAQGGEGLEGEAPVVAERPRHDLGPVADPRGVGHALRADAFEADLREFEARQEAESSGDGGGDTDDGDGGAATAPPPSKAAQVIRVSASDGSGIDALTAALGRLTAASDLASAET